MSDAGYETTKIHNQSVTTRRLQADALCGPTTKISIRRLMLVLAMHLALSSSGRNIIAY